jgi:hypothetical protein
MAVGETGEANWQRIGDLREDLHDTRVGMMSHAGIGNIEVSETGVMAKMKDTARESYQGGKRDLVDARTTQRRGMTGEEAMRDRALGMRHNLQGNMAVMKSRMHMAGATALVAVVGEEETSACDGAFERMEGQDRPAIAILTIVAGGIVLRSVVYHGREMVKFSSKFQMC